ncbi:MAG: phosphonate ABC transporter, permease protein PhnE [Acidimicrobiales bacterium]|nr:phosphonate ABC transporter, permease protein PhnE [Acidimicrobiales bacterium]
MNIRNLKNREVSHPEQISRPWTPQRSQLWFTVLAIFVLLAWSINRVDLSLGGIVEIFEGWPETQNLLSRMVPPFIPSEDFTVITKAALDTFFIAFAGTAFGLVLGIPLGLLSARNIMPFAPVRAFARAIVVFSRATPALVFALCFVRLYGIGVLAGLLAIGIHSIGMIGKLITDAAEEIDPGPREGVIATGAGSLQDLYTGIWSQMVPTVISISLYRLELDFRSAPILGWVGAGGIGLILRGYAGSLRYQELLGITILIVVLVVILEILSATTRHALLGKTETDLPGKPGRMTQLFLGGTARPGKKIADWMINKSSNKEASESESQASRSLTPPWTRERIKVNSIGLIFFVLLIISVLVPDIATSRIVDGSQKLPSFIARLTPNDWSWFTDRLFSDMIDTIAIGFAATGIALLFAIPFSFLAASNTAPGRFVYLISRLFMLLVRCVPELVVAVIFVAAIGPGPRTGTLALAIGMFGFITKLFADSIEEARQGIRDGVNSTGANRLQESVTGVLPQVAPSMVSHSLYLLDVAIRSSTILGIVGGGGIGFLLMSAAKRLYFETLGGIIFCIFVVVFLVEIIATWIRRKII